MKTSRRKLDDFPAFEMRPWIAAALLPGSLLSGCAGCSGSHGVIVEARPDASFVKERARFYVRSERGIERVSLDGSARAVVFASSPGSSSLSVLDTSPDQRTFLIQNQNTELFVGDIATGALRKVEVLGDRCSAAAFAPDGKRFAASRHSDFSQPSAKPDDTIYLVDAATLTATVIPRSSESWPVRIEWAADMSGLYVTMAWEGVPQWISLADRVRHPGLKAAPTPLDSAHNSPPSCPMTPVTARWGTTIRMVPASSLNGALQVQYSDEQDLEALPDAGPPVVTLQGRKRGFHDHEPNFNPVVSSPGCAHVLFGHDGDVWVADAKGGAAALIVKGWADFLFFVRD
jgi:hypothetical protein